MILLFLIVILLAYLVIDSYVSSILGGAAILIVLIAMAFMGIQKSKKSKIEENKHMENKPDDDINIRFDS